MLLSIAMIVKNEEKNIERCLEALRALNNKIDYEIVIVDTGSEDRTIEIAKNYTKRIYEHKWNNDFAAMRNKSISYCTGQWILILDADEVLENHKDLIGFFVNGKCNNFNSATIRFKNMLSEKKDDYLIGTLVRLFRNKKEFCYKGRIHEQPNISAPTAVTNITLLHYGYSRESYELMEYKYERNRKLLMKDLEEVKETKDLIYTYFQLAQTYAMANKHHEAGVSINKAFELVKESVKRERFLYVYHFLATNLLAKGNYKGVIEILEEALEYSKDHLDFYYMLSKSYSALNKFDKANGYFKEYFKLHKKIEDGYLGGDVSVINVSFSKKDEVLRDYILCCYNGEKIDDIEKMYTDLKQDSYKEELKEIYFYTLMKKKKTKGIIEYYKDKKIKDGDIQSIINVMERVINEDNCFEDVTIETGLEELDCRMNLYINFKYKNQDIENYDFNIFNLTNFYKWKGELVKEYYAKDSNFIEELKTLKKQDLNLYISFVSDSYKCLENLYRYSEENFIATSLDELNLLVAIGEVLLINKSIDDTKFEQLVKGLYINKNNYINRIYSKDLLKSEDASKIISIYDDVWLEINKCLRAYGNKIYYIRKLKELLEEVPQYNRMIKLFLKNMDSNPISKDMEKEKNNLLNIIENLLQESKASEAMGMLKELQKIFKYDYEILNYLGIGNYMLGNSKEAIMNLALSNCIKENNFDTVYNLAWVLQNDLKLKEAKYYYLKAYDLCDNEELKKNIIIIVEGLKEN